MQSGLERGLGTEFCGFAEGLRRKGRGLRTLGSEASLKISRQDQEDREVLAGRLLALKRIACRLFSRRRIKARAASRRRWDGTEK